MKGAQPHVVGAALFELDVLAHHLDHVDAGKQFAQKRLGNGHGCIVGARPAAICRVNRLQGKLLQ